MKNERIKKFEIDSSVFLGISEEIAPVIPEQKLQNTQNSFDDEDQDIDPAENNFQLTD